MSDPWITPELIAFRKAARACFLSGESYRELKDILSTEDELTREERGRNTRVTDRVQDIYPAPPRSK